ncbi:MAG: PIN domain-containing protein [Bradyrhizobiaceae bacterium]|nr:PIN domain-containing protein [Bradyrhizobiaceae bacterium]
MQLVDTNILLDIISDDPIWAEWSYGQLERALVAGHVSINDVVYAELSVSFDRIEELDQRLTDVGIEVERVPRPALFLAGKVFRRYRAAGGVRTGVLPDFFIGAHAAIAGAPLLTRDPSRYRTYFPQISLIAPD